jgi:2-(1,2-epoxy-1,2-dihydrophenyl)acetyl-CoA isomerase
MKLIRVESHEGGVSRLVLARSEMHNALVPELLADLLEALHQISADSSIRAVVLAADGPAFSIGGDMRRFHHELDANLAAYSAGLVGKLNEAILTLIDLKQPVIAAVQGIVTGGSIGLVLACDLAYLAPQAAFKAHYATAGFGPDGGWTVLMPRLAGSRRAAAALLLNRTVRATEAVAWGLANDVVDAEQLQATTLAAARKIAAYPVGTMRAAKALLRNNREQLVLDLEAERSHFLQLIGTADARTGIAAFLRQFQDYPGAALPI